ASHSRVAASRASRGSARPGDTASTTVGGGGVDTVLAGAGGVVAGGASASITGETVSAAAAGTGAAGAGTATSVTLPFISEVSFLDNPLGETVGAGLAVTPPSRRCCSSE